MSKRLVYICSPCRGDYEKNISEARCFCRIVMNHFPDVIPIAPHIYFTQFLDDNDPTERSLALEAGLSLLDMCDEIWVYGLKNPSEGMRAEIDYALKNGIKIRDGFDHNNWDDEMQPKDEQSNKGSFDTDDFFEAALRRSYAQASGSNTPRAALEREAIKRSEENAKNPPKTAGNDEAIRAKMEALKERLG